MWPFKKKKEVKPEWRSTLGLYTPSTPTKIDNLIAALRERGHVVAKCVLSPYQWINPPGDFLNVDGHLIHFCPHYFADTSLDKIVKRIVDHINEAEAGERYRTPKLNGRKTK